MSLRNIFVNFLRMGEGPLNQYTKRSTWYVEGVSEVDWL